MQQFTPRYMIYIVAVTNTKVAVARQLLQHIHNASLQQQQLPRLACSSTALLLGFFEFQVGVLTTTAVVWCSPYCHPLRKTRSVAHRTPCQPLVDHLQAPPAASRTYRQARCGVWPARRCGQQVTWATASGFAMDATPAVCNPGKPHRLLIRCQQPPIMMVMHEVDSLAYVVITCSLSECIFRLSSR